MPDQTLFRIEPALAGKRRECVAFARSPLTTGALIYSICAVIALTLIFVSTQQIARKASVNGRVELRAGELKLYPNDRRLVAEILVTEGQHVETGQLLAVLHGLRYAADSGSSGQSGYSQLFDSLNQQAIRLQESRTAAEQRAAIGHDNLASRRRFLRTHQTSLHRSVTSNAELAQLASEQKTRGEKLYDSGYLPLADLEELQRREVQQQEALAKNERALLNLKEQLETLDHENLLLTNRLQNDLRNVDAQLGLNTREREQLRMSFEQRVRAPNDGYITGVLKLAGSIAEPTTPVITMMRAKTAYRARLWAGSHAAGELKVGQKVNLMLDAFPHQKHGLLGGEIIHINTGALTLRELDVPWEGGGSAFSVTVELDKKNPLYWRIKPGMSLTADIKLDSSLLVARLFEPLLLAFSRAL